MKTTEERFWAKVEKSDGCWNWVAATDKGTGYGRVQIKGKTRYAHRISYELQNGAIPAGLTIDHVCRVRRCVRPSHLRAVTNKQNSEHVGLSAANRSGVRGVSWYAPTGRWVAHVRHNRQLFNAGYYSTIEDAEAAVVAKRNELFTCNDLDRKVNN